MKVNEDAELLCRHCMVTKKIMTREPAVLHALLEHLTEALIIYVIHQIDSGAQVSDLGYTFKLIQFSLNRDSHSQPG